MHHHSSSAAAASGGKPAGGMFPALHRATGLARYGSAPGSLLASIAESVVGIGGGDVMSRLGSDGSGGGSAMSRFFTGDSPCLTAESTCKQPPLDLESAATAAASAVNLHQQGYGGGILDEEPAGDPDPCGHGRASAANSHLFRQHSSPAGFFTHLMSENGYSLTRGMANYSTSGASNSGAHAMAGGRLQTQLSFSREDSFSHISEVSGLQDMGESSGSGKSSDEVGGGIGQSYISGSYQMGSWDKTNSIVFGNPPSKRSKVDGNGDIITGIHGIDSQFSIPKTSLDMTNAVDKLLHDQQDYTPFKVRAKRGCATHPRSIAERDRRTRIGEKLRKLQDLMPNIDKQTNTADMLDLAVQHIKALQSQVQDLKEERECCTCACKLEIL